MLWDSVFLDPNGNLYACCHYRPDVLGNIYHQDLATIWSQSSALKAFRQQSLAGRLECAEKCTILTDQEKYCTELPELNPKYPRRLWILYGEQCNIRCVMCPQDHRSQTMLDASILKKNIRWDEVKEIDLQGGEVLAMGAARDFYVWLIEEKKGCKINLITNGLLVNDAWAERIIAHAGWVEVSLNAATKETHERVNCGSSFEKALSGLCALVEAKRRLGAEARVVFHFTIIPENVREIADAVIFARDLGCDEIRFGYDASVPLYLANRGELVQKLRESFAGLDHKVLPLRIDTLRLQKLGIVQQSACDGICIMDVSFRRPHNLPKRFYLVNFHYKDFYSESIEMPSLGPAYILQHLADNNIKTRFYEWSFNSNLNALLADIKDFKPDLIGCSFMSNYYRETYKYIDAIHDLGIPVVCGGAHVNSSTGSEVLSTLSADYLIKGEGEKSLLLLINHLNQADFMTKIPGLIYRRNCEVIENCPVILNPDELNYPRYADHCLDRYKNGIIFIQTSRGCPYMCTFCQQSALLGKKWRARSPESILSELEYWGAQGRTTFVFADDNLTLDKNRIMRLCLLLSKSKYRFNMHTSGVRIDNVDYETLHIMKQVGFNYLSFGIESGNDRVLKEIRKGITLTQIHNTLEMSCKLGFDIKLYFIINNRTETYEEVQDSFNLARQYPINMARFTNMIPLPGTYDYEWVVKHGQLLYLPDSYINNPNDYLYVPLYDGPGMSLFERFQVIKEARGELLRFDNVKRKINDLSPRIRT